MAKIRIIKSGGMKMENLKNKIINALNQNGNIENLLDDLSDYHKKLSANIANPLFSKDAKNKMLEICANLRSLEKSLYRYNAAKVFNHLSDADNEKSNAQNIVLKGGISNVRYVWRSEQGENTCEKCSSLDGEEFDLYDDIPPMPHPNCKCHIEVIADNSNKTDIPIPTDTSKTNDKPKNTTYTPGNWIMPCNGKIVGVYGEPRTTHIHNGIDIAVPVGTSVMAIADGVVIYAGNNDPNGYGNYVIINHGKINGVIVTSEYGHISSWNVKYGQIVKQGDIIAKSGNTGMSTGPHLHLTTKKDGKAINPTILLDFIRSIKEKCLSVIY